MESGKIFRIEMDSLLGWLARAAVKLAAIKVEFVELTLRLKLFVWGDNDDKFRVLGCTEELIRESREK